MKNTEALIHEKICAYLKSEYPDVLFNSDMSGIKLTMGQAIKAKKLRSSKGFPDLVIYEPRKMGFVYYGLFLELKKEGTKLFKKNGEAATKHIEEQQEMIIKLLNLGYFASFACGFNEAKKIIDDYLKLR